VQRTCETCNIISTNEPEWEKHMKSSKHKKRVASVQKMREVREFLRRREGKREEAQKEGKAEGGTEHNESGAENAVVMGSGK
jgi:hypothetical protein